MSELREVLKGLLDHSRELANDFEYGDHGYGYWAERAKELLSAMSKQEKKNSSVTGEDEWKQRLETIKKWRDSYWFVDNPNASDIHEEIDWLICQAERLEWRLAHELSQESPSRAPTIDEWVKENPKANDLGFEIYESLTIYGVSWSQKNDLLRNILDSVRRFVSSESPSQSVSEREVFRQIIHEIRACYPADIWLEDGGSIDCKSAKMARLTCDNIEKLLDERIASSHLQTEGESPDSPDLRWYRRAARNAERIQELELENATLKMQLEAALESAKEIPRLVFRVKELEDVLKEGPSRPGPENQRASTD